MSATLVARGLAAGHGARVLFSGLDLVVAPGDVVGLVGVNGAGKSTLLRTLAGELPAEDGSRRRQPAHGHPRLPAAGARAAGGGDGARRARPAHRRRRRAGRARRARPSTSPTGRPGADDAYGDALERWLALGGADLEERAEEVVAEVAPGVALDAPMTGLSGGQAARVGLAALLLSRYDVLLLDEPTNDLDLAGLDQLERFVAGSRAGIVVVSHDREFLARTVTRVVELDLAQQLVRVHDGGYEAYLAEREVARRHAREEYEEYADTKAGLEARARMQRNWMAKGVRDSIKKAKDGDKHIKAHNRGDRRRSRRPRRKQTDRRIERLEVVEEPRKEWELRMEIAAAPRAGAVVATLRGAVVRRGGFTARAGRPAGRLGRPGGDHRRQRLGQVDAARRAARAGCRSTRGRRRSGPSVRIGEIDQARGLFLGAEQLLDAFSAEVPDWPTAEVRTLLAKFGLIADHVLRPADDALAGRAHPGGAGAAAGARASTCWCSTSRPTTSTCPRSSSSRRRWPPTRAPCCWSPTTAGCSRRSHTTRRLEVVDGRSPSAGTQSPAEPSSSATPTVSISAQVRARGGPAPSGRAAAPLRSRMWSASSASPVNPRSVNSASAAPCSATTSTTSLDRPRPPPRPARAGPAPGPGRCPGGRGRPPAGPRRRGPTSPAAAGRRRSRSPVVALDAPPSGRPEPSPSPTSGTVSGR